MITLSLIIPWKMGNLVREQSFKNLLNCLKIQKLEDVSYELIVVEPTTELNINKARQKFLELLPVELISCKYIQLITNDPFNKSWCMNVGARTARNEFLIFVDADSLFGDRYLQVIQHHLNSTPKTHNRMMLCWNYLVGLPGKDNPISRHITPSSTCTLGGIWCAEREFFFKEFGGMNENFVGYGGEDNDAYERAIVLLKVAALSWMAYPLVHQYHDWEKPSEIATPYFLLARSNPIVITERIKAANIGKIEGPTFIKVDDLKI